MNNRNISPTPISSIIKLPQSLCPQHSLPYQCYCSHQMCSTKIRVCKKCKQDHSPHAKFLTQKKHVIEDLNKGLKRCFQKIIEFDERSKELMKLMKVAKMKAVEEYEVMEKRLVRQLKENKEVLELIVSKIKDICEKIEQKQRTRIYFAKLHTCNLLQLRIKLSNVQGMQNFKQKSQKLRELTSKSSSQSLQLLYNQLNTLQQQFNEKLKTNTTFKLGQVIALKNSKKQLENKGNVARNVLAKEREKENIVGNGKRQKQRPKTTLNFGDGIISGILNFLNF